MYTQLAGILDYLKSLKLNGSIRQSFGYSMIGIITRSIDFQLTKLGSSTKRCFIITRIAIIAYLS